MNEGLIRTMWTYRKTLSRLGTAAGTLAGIRSARDIVLPIWGASIGLEAQTVLLVVGVAGLLDFALAYSSGQVMDRFGRLWTVVPSLLLMGLGFGLLAFTHDLAGTLYWYARLTVVIGIGNGLSGGILATLGADLAPDHNPAPFLGLWRTLGDTGGMVAPLVFSGITAAVSITAATGFMGIIALLGAAGFVRWLPRFITEPPKDSTA